MHQARKLIHADAGFTRTRDQPCQQPALPHSPGDSRIRAARKCQLGRSHPTSRPEHTRTVTPRAHGAHQAAPKSARSQHQQEFPPTLRVHALTVATAAPNSPGPGGRSSGPEMSTVVAVLSCCTCLITANMAAAAQGQRGEGEGRAGARERTQCEWDVSHCIRWARHASSGAVRAPLPHNAARFSVATAGTSVGKVLSQPGNKSSTVSLKSLMRELWEEALGGKEGGGG